MFKLFRKNRYYKLNETEKKWTKNLLINRLTKELELAGVTIYRQSQKNYYRINTNGPAVLVAFASSSYSDADKVELIASLMVRVNDDEIFWEDLFTICKDAYGSKYRNLCIGKDESWEHSKLAKECRDVYAPLFEAMQDPVQLKKIMHGSPVLLNNKPVQLWRFSSK